jgi:hypothetical protein
MFRDAHKKGLIKHDHYKLIQMVEEPSLFAENEDARAIMEKMEGVAFSLCGSAEPRPPTREASHASHSSGAGGRGSDRKAGRDPIRFRDRDGRTSLRNCLTTNIQHPTRLCRAKEYCEDIGCR